MLNWIVRNRTIWSFNRVYLQNVFTYRIFNIYAKAGFVIKEPAVVDILENQTKPNIIENSNQYTKYIISIDKSMHLDYA